MSWILLFFFLIAPQTACRTRPNGDSARKVEKFDIVEPSEKQPASIPGYGLSRLCTCSGQGSWTDYWVAHYCVQGHLGESRLSVLVTGVPTPINQSDGYQSVAWGEVDLRRDGRAYQGVGVVGSMQLLPNESSWLLIHDFASSKNVSDLDCRGLKSQEPSLLVEPSVRPHDMGDDDLEESCISGQGRWLDAKCWCADAVINPLLELCQEHRPQDKYGERPSTAVP